MLNVKVATDKERGRIWDLQGAFPLSAGNAKCPIWSVKAGKLGQNQLKDNQKDRGYSGINRKTKQLQFLIMIYPR